MFANDIVNSDPFLDMGQGAQLLYFHLGMQADDDGFVSPQRIMRAVGAQIDDLKVLEAKKFIIPFPSGVRVIRHWREHNTVRMDRYAPSTYQEEKANLRLNGTVYFLSTESLPSGNQVATKGGTSKEVSKKESTPLSLEELKKDMKTKWVSKRAGSWAVGASSRPKKITKVR